MAYDIFISYRRTGGYETAKHLYDLLTRDNYSVSFDVDTLHKGKFPKELLRRIDECSDFIILLNEGVFDRCVEEDIKQDWLRSELAYAIKKRKNIIPVMLEGFTGFPDNLPEDIAEVSDWNGPGYDREYFDAFYAKLKEKFLGAPSPVPKPKEHQCLLKIRPNLACNVFVDGEFAIKAEANRLTKLPLNRGTFEMEFVSTENEQDKYACEYKLTDPEELIKVDLESIAAERQESEKKERERKERERLESIAAARKEAERKERERLDLERKERERLESIAAARKEAERKEKEKLERERIEKMELEKFIENGKYGFKDKSNGRIIIPAKYDAANSFSEGLATVKLNNKCGFINKTGKVVIPFIYDYAKSFSEGLAIVKLNGKYGFIDKTGKVVIPLQYDDAHSFSEGLACVLLNGKRGFIDKTGKEVISLNKENKFSKALNDVGVGLITKVVGLTIVGLDKGGKGEYDDAWSFRGGKAKVLLNGEVFYIDKSGNRID